MSIGRWIPVSVKRAAWPFLTSRLIIVVLFACIPELKHELANGWGGTELPMSLQISPGAVKDGFAGVYCLSDSTYYYAIASEGYERRPFDASRMANWAFFPLYPLLWRATKTLTGEWIWSGVVTSNLLSFIALCLLWCLAKRLGGSGRIADNAVVFASFWPSAYFMMLPYTESLFLALVTASLLASLSERPWLASMVGGFAGVSRVNGVFIAPAILIGRWRRGERRFLDAVNLFPVGVGLLAFMAYLWAITGNPFAFRDIQAAWGRSPHLPWDTLLEVIRRPLTVATPWNPVIIQFGATMLACCSIVTCWRKGWTELAVFTALTLLAPLSTGTLVSMTRYIGGAPGIFLALAVWAERRPPFGQLWLATSVAAMTILCTLFTLRIDIGAT